MDVSLAEIIERRDLLSPREATTLTLAIGREWERLRTRGADHGLPDHAHITLTATGGIVFTSNNRHRTDDPAVARALSALLGQLLGLDEQEAPRHHIPGGLLITIAGQLGPMELPSSRDDGFITALSRFADDEAALVRVYGRVVAARRLTGSHTSRTNAAARQRRGPERRRQPQAVAALRRAVRDLERQTFEARSNSRARGRVSRRRLLDTGVAMAIGLLLGVTGFVLGTNGASRPDVAAAPPSQTSAIAPSSPAAPMPLRPRAVLEKKTRAVRPAVARSPSKKPRRSDSKPHLAFAGGARSIPWVSAVRRD